ncbi:MAG: hypothetical protein ABI472_14845 [Ginsengibacter sp.]
MKKMILPAFAAIILAMSACTKDPVNHTTSLTASKTTGIKKGEPVLFTFTNNPDTIKWKVTPTTNAQIAATGSLASVKFGRGGTFTVIATSGNAVDSSVVHVEDSAYTPPVTSTQLPIVANEKVIITATRLDSAGNSGLIFYAHTQSSYTCFTNYLTSVFALSGGDYSINFTGVSVPPGCTTGTAQAGSFEYLIPMADGTHTLTIMLKGTTYTGSVVKAGSTYTINWSYTSGVTIAPSTL